MAKLKEQMAKAERDLTLRRLEETKKFLAIMERRRQRTTAVPSPSSSDVVDKDNATGQQSRACSSESAEIVAQTTGSQSPAPDDGDVVFVCEKPRPAGDTVRVSKLKVEAESERLDGGSSSSSLRASSLPPPPPVELLVVPPTSATVADPVSVLKSRVDDLDLLNRFCNPERPVSALGDFCASQQIPCVGSQQEPAPSGADL